MFEFHSIAKLLYINIIQWFGTKKSLLIMGISVVFSIYVFIPLTRILITYQETIPPAAFVIYLTNPRMQILHGGILVFMFSDLLSSDDYYSLSRIRTGRLVFILGQVLFVFLLSALYVFFIMSLSLLMTLPVLSSFHDWGGFIFKLSSDITLYTRETGILLQGLPAPWFYTVLNPFNAIVLSALFMWLTSVFTGLTMLFFTVLFNRICAIAAAGVMIFMVMFSMYTGSLFVGEWLNWLSPLSWSYIATLDLQHKGQTPSLSYSLIFLLVGIILTSLVSCLKYIRKDEINGSVY